VAPVPVHPCPTCGALNDDAFERCVRCGAGVGAAAGAPARPRVVTVQLGARSRLVAAKAFGALGALVFLAQLALSISGGHGVPLLSSKAPRIELRLGALVAEPALVAEEPFRLLSAVFVHFGLLHFAMNAYAYVDLSRVAETFLGAGRFAVAFVVSGIAGFAATAVFGAIAGGPPAFTAGASGAIFGLMGVVLGALVARRDPKWKSFALRAVLYSVLFGFAVNASGSGILVNNTAHVGGLVVGALVGWLGRRPPIPGSRSARIWGALGVAAFAASVASVALALRSQLPDLVR
jgi:membrane associated rhomboid family serine protease